MKFEELDLNDNVLDALYDMHFDECTPVQEHCIPPILEGKDLMGVAQTGTGKTAAYLLPILSRLDDGGFPEQAVNCVIMSPTRELAQQIDQAMQGFSYYTPGVSSVAVYGGNDGNRFDQETRSMRMGADMIIATPGRLISHISLGNVDLSKVSFFVLDEADRMLDMGFADDIMKIASYLPETCQTIMFSATMPKDIEKLAQKLLKNPAEVKLAVSKPAEKIKQTAYLCYEVQKLEIIKDVFKSGDLQRVIIFSGSKQKVKRINQALVRLKIKSGEMHSDLDQAQRDEMMFQFKSGQLDVLVATDIVARGIDIDDIAMVINYDVPHDAEDYVHRIGRTARADRDGRAITFVCEEDMFAFHQIEKFLEMEVEKLPLPEGLGDAPEYVTSRRPRSSAKDRRKQNRDNNAHRRPPHHASERKEKQRNQKQIADGETVIKEKRENVEVTKEQEVTSTVEVAQVGEGENSPQSKSGERRRRRNRRRGRREGVEQPLEPSTVVVDESNNAPAKTTSELAKKPAEEQVPSGEGTAQRKRRRKRRSHGEERETVVRASELATQSRDDSRSNEGNARNDNASQRHNSRQNNPRKDGERREQQSRKVHGEGDRRENRQRGGRKGNGRRDERRNVSTNPRKQLEARRAEQTQGESSETGFKALVKNPLKWLRSLGKK